jgi:hypothetical protein
VVLDIDQYLASEYATAPEMVDRTAADVSIVAAKEREREQTSI